MFLGKQIMISFNDNTLFQLSLQCPYCIAPNDGTPLEAAVQAIKYSLLEGVERCYSTGNNKFATSGQRTSGQMPVMLSSIVPFAVLKIPISITTYSETCNIDGFCIHSLQENGKKHPLPQNFKAQTYYSN